MIANPALYVASTRDLTAAVSWSMSQVTGRERKLVQTVRVKFALTNLVYYVCWTPNLINGILLWTLWFELPIKVIISLWYVMVSIEWNDYKIYKYFVEFSFFCYCRLWQILFKHFLTLWYIRGGEEAKNSGFLGEQKSRNENTDLAVRSGLFFLSLHRFWIYVTLRTLASMDHLLYDTRETAIRILIT